MMTTNIPTDHSKGAWQLADSRFIPHNQDESKRDSIHPTEPSLVDRNDIDGQNETVDGQVHPNESQVPFVSSPTASAVRLSPLVQPADADVEIPGSKSLTNRALILAALADGANQPSTIHGILHCDDSYWCLRALESLGIPVSVDKSTATIKGTGGQWPLREAEVYTGSSGTLSRFLPPALAVATGDFTLRASDQMSRRPVGPLLDALSQLGADVEFLAQEGFYPFILHAHGLRGGKVTIPGNVSSQYLSGILMAAPFAEAPLVIELESSLVQPAYIDLTLQLMQDFGVQVTKQEDSRGLRFHIQPAKYQARTVALEADASTAGYFFATAALTGGRVRVTNLSATTTQPDIHLLDVLERMGATVQRGPGWTEVQGPKQLQGGFSISMHEFSDQALTVGALSVFADAPITVTDVGHIRKHESDRIDALHQCLRKLGIQMTERDDGFTVFPGSPTAAHLPTFDDHRVAMSMALIGVKVSGLELENPGCVSKTCPDFFERMERIGLGVEFMND